MAKRPNSMRHLDDAIRRASGGGAGGYVRLRTLMANAVVAQKIHAVTGGGDRSAASSTCSSSSNAPSLPSTR